MAKDLSLIISEYSNTVSKYECENKLPIAMWVELENGKNDLIRILNIVNENNVDLTKYDDANDITSEIQNSNGLSPFVEEVGPVENQSKNKNNKCNFCNPIKINWNLKLNKPEIMVSLRASVSSVDFLFKSNTAIVCSTALSVSQGCIPDLVKLIGMVLMALSVLISSVNLESFSLSGLISATLGAILNIAIKKAMFIANISVTKSECFSTMIKEIMDSLPTSQSLNERLDPELLKKFNLYNPSPTNLNAAYDRLDSYATKAATDKLNKIFDSMGVITDTVDMALEKVNQWIEGLFALSNYIPCERERSNTKPSELLEKISNIVTIINVITAVISKKKSKECSGDSTKDDNTSKDTNGNSPDDTNSINDNALTPDEIAEVIADIIDIDGVVKDPDGTTIAIIVPDIGLGTVYLDMFGCNLPNFMEVFTQQNFGSISPIGNSPLYNSNTIKGNNETYDNNYDNTFNNNSGGNSNTGNNGNTGNDWNNGNNNNNIYDPNDPNITYGYGVHKPLIINVSDLPSDILLSDNFVHISPSVDIIREVMENINSGYNGLDEELISNNPPIIRPEDKKEDLITPNSPNGNDERLYEIDNVLLELERMSSSSIDIKTTGECK